ncbi:GlsB/YeaQ/YmgE family stress response membrane protein [Candidatus Saccharibacteria bacterium TM7i]|nr:GlsB/YeaQ/YmgE family stress response membrane protein [Candidatus Saccharibacteria bacterium TM7i]
MWSIIVWIVVGGLAGWVASMIMKTDENQGLVGNIVVGILGGLVGGFLVGMLGGEGFTGFNIWSFLVALLGSIVLLFLWRLVTGGRGAARQ